MSTEPDTNPNRQAPYQPAPVPARRPTSRLRTSKTRTSEYQQASRYHRPPRRSGPQAWVLAIGAAVAVALVALAVALLTHSSAAPATTGTSTSTSAPTHPADQPRLPHTPPAQPDQSRNGRLDRPAPATSDPYACGAYTAVGWRHCST